MDLGKRMTNMTFITRRKTPVAGVLPQKCAVKAACLLATTLIFGNVPLASAAPNAPAPPPGITEDLQAQIDQAIRQLGAVDFRDREQAVHRLIVIGEAASPALREAAASDDPEVATRANSVLASFAY